MRQAVHDLSAQLAPRDRFRWPTSLNSASSFFSFTENLAPGCTLTPRPVLLPGDPSRSVRDCISLSNLRSWSLSHSQSLFFSPLTPKFLSSISSSSPSLSLFALALLSNTCTLPFRGAAQELDRGSVPEGQEAFEHRCVRSSSSCPIGSDHEGYDDPLHLLWCPGIPPPPLGDLPLPRHRTTRSGFVAQIWLVFSTKPPRIGSPRSASLLARPFSLRVLALWHSRWKARVGPAPP